MIIIFMKMFLTEHVTEKKKMKCKAKVDKNGNWRKNIPRLLFRNTRYKNALYILYRYCCYLTCFYVGCNVIKHKLPLFRFNIPPSFAKKKSLSALLRQLYRPPFTGLRIAESCYLYLHTGSLYPWSHFDKTDEEGRHSSHKRSKNLKYNHAATNQFLGGIGSNPV